MPKPTSHQNGDEISIYAVACNHDGVPQLYSETVTVRKNRVVSRRGGLGFPWGCRMVLPLADVHITPRDAVVAYRRALRDQLAEVQAQLDAANGLGFHDDDQ